MPTEIKNACLGLGSGAANEGKDCLEGKEASVQKKMKLTLTLKWLGMCLSNFKLSLTRAMKRGKVDTEKLRTCRECQLTKASKGVFGKTEQEQV